MQVRWESIVHDDYPCDMLHIYIILVIILVHFEHVDYVLGIFRLILHSCVLIRCLSVPWSDWRCLGALWSKKDEEWSLAKTKQAIPWRPVEPELGRTGRIVLPAHFRREKGSWSWPGRTGRVALPARFGREEGSWSWPGSWSMTYPAVFMRSVRNVKPSKVILVLSLDVLRASEPHINTFVSPNLGLISFLLKNTLCLLL